MFLLSLLLKRYGVLACSTLLLTTNSVHAMQETDNQDIIDKKNECSLSFEDGDVVLYDDDEQSASYSDELKIDDNYEGSINRSMPQQIAPVDTQQIARPATDSPQSEPIKYRRRAVKRGRSLQPQTVQAPIDAELPEEFRTEARDSNTTKAERLWEEVLSKQPLPTIDTLFAYIRTNNQQGLEIFLRAIDSIKTLPAHFLHHRLATHHGISYSAVAFNNIVRSVTTVHPGYGLFAMDYYLQHCHDEQTEPSQAILVRFQNAGAHSIFLCPSIRTLPDLTTGQRVGAYLEWMKLQWRKKQKALSAWCKKMPRCR